MWTIVALDDEALVPVAGEAVADEEGAIAGGEVEADETWKVMHGLPWFLALYCDSNDNVECPQFYTALYQRRLIVIGDLHSMESPLPPRLFPTHFFEFINA